MIKRSAVTGLLAGALLALVAIYPVLSTYLGPELLPASGPGALRTVLLVLTGLAGLAVLALIGSLAAWRSQVTDTAQGFSAGAISGLAASLMFYLLLYAPTTALAASLKLWGYLPTPQELYPPSQLSLAYIRDMTSATYLGLALCLAAGTLLGGIEGAIVGARGRQRVPERPSLLDVIASPHPRRRWLAEHDEVWRAGILAGCIGGCVIWLGSTIAFLSNLRLNWPALKAAVQETPNLLTRAAFADTLSVFLVPLFLIAVLGIGALAVLLLRDPPRRHLSRFQTVMIAGGAAAMVILTVVLQLAYFGLGMSRYVAALVVLEAQPAAAGGATYPLRGMDLHLSARWLEWLGQFIHSPQIVAPLFYLLPIVLFAVVLIVVLFWLAPQAVFYGLTLPLVFRRPVDRAARIARAINNQTSGPLPQIYGLYANDEQAVKVLPHLAFLLKDQAAAEVVAAYHTLSIGAEDAERATAPIRQTVAEQEGWRWRIEVGELHRVLGEGLAARALAQVTAIQTPPRETTSSLPVLLANSCDGIAQVLDELKKVGRVDDLSTKLIFLHSAQAALLDLHRHTEQESLEHRTCATLFPEIAILHSLLDLWQGFIVTAVRDLQGRADLQATLLTHRTGFAPRVRQCIVVTNQGLNVAQNVSLEVARGEGYEVIEGAEQKVDILGPQESRELELWLIPDEPRRVRLSWLLTFDDAVDTGRQVEFADAMEFVQEEEDKPFQRIFPIPYVTGTPLRSGEIFVGRQDVFEFVREHLVGTYQNNVIVLHGQRRTGKTSILYRLRELLADTHVAVLVDMQGKAARGTADFLYALSDDIVYALENCQILVDLPERSEYEQAPEFTFRSRFLRSVVSKLDTRNLLFMFDEFEELQKRVEDGRLEPEVFSFLRNLMQHESRLDFVFSGTHKLEQLGSEYWSILFNIAAFKRITFLEPGEVRRLITEPVAQYGMEYDPLAIERIIHVTAGHPYFTQVVCHEMVAYHNEFERSYITVTCVDQVLERIVERGEAHFKYIWAGATPEEQRVMMALADLLPDTEATATPAQVSEELARKGLELGGDAQDQALAGLQAKDIVARTGRQSSLYRFKIDLIRRWIANTRPSVVPAAGR
jgi:AAA domain